MPINPMYYFGQEAMRQISQAYDRGYNAGEQAKWHPYPLEKPNVPVWKKASKGKYYTAYEFLVTQKLAGGVSHVITSVYFNGEFKDPDVIAWAELPKPYKEVEE